MNMSEEVKISTEALPKGFYLSDPWYESMIGFYTQQQSTLSEEELAPPLKRLADDLENILVLEANLPDMAYKFLLQCINPLFEEKEYRDKVFSKLMENAEKNEDDRYKLLANCLLDVRCFFEKNETFLKENFGEVIANVQADNDNEKFDKFAETIQGITYAHVKQITDMLKDR